MEAAQQSFPYTLHTIDLHACGEPARVVVKGMPDIEGVSMTEKRVTLMTKHDVFRKVFLQEPRGYPCQNADIIFPSALPGVEFGYVILEQNCIYPMMSGHNTICVATALLYSGMIAIPDDEGQNTVEFDLEAPAGIISIRAMVHNKRIKGITLRNVPSFRGLSNCKVNVPELGMVTVDVVYGGMWYCIVDTANIPTDSSLLPPLSDQSKSVLPLTPDNGKSICRIGEMIKTACREQFPVDHPCVDYPGCDILVFCSPGTAETVAKGSHAKNAVVMSNGVLNWDMPDTWTAMLDRSPCGTGTSAVMTNLYLNGKLHLDTEFVHESIIGTQFTGKLVAETKVGDFTAVIPEITGSAWVTQICQVFVDPDDPFPEGYTVSDIWS